MIRTITIHLGEIILDVTGDYSPATPDVWYLPNGDPGYPGESEEFEISAIEYMGKDITDVVGAFNGVLCSSIRSQFDTYPIQDIWLRIEEECLSELTK